MANIQQYQGFTEDAADQDIAEANAMSGSIYMDLEQGENFVRFLPLAPGMKSPYRKTSMHYIEIPGHDKKFVFSCPRVELQQPCLACAKGKELARSPSPADRAAADDVGAGLRVFANVLNRRVPDSPPMVLGFGKMILNELTKIRKSTRAGGDFTNPGPDGFDIIITKTGEQLSTRYTVTPDRGNSPLAATQEEIDAICELRHDLDSCVTTVVPEALQGAWASTMSTLGVGSSFTRPTQVQVPRAAPVGQIGAGLMGGGVPAPAPVAPVASAADAGVEYDDDFNVIVR